MYVRQMLFITGIAFLGNEISTGLGIPIPATVLGLVILFLALVMRLIKLKDIEDCAMFIVDNLSVFFVVPTVGIMLYFDLLTSQLVQIIVPLIASILLGMFAAGKVTELFIERMEKASSALADAKTGTEADLTTNQTEADLTANQTEADNKGGGRHE